MRTTTIAAAAAVLSLLASACLHTHEGLPKRDPTAHDAVSAGDPRAIERLAAAWKDAIAKGEKAQVAFVDAHVHALVNGYENAHDREDRKRIVELLAEMHDARAKPALIGALTSWVPGKNDEEARIALRALVFMKNDFTDDAEVGKALLTALEAARSTGEAAKVAGGIDEAIGALRPKIMRQGLLALVAQPNEGDLDLSMRQVIAAHGLGVIGDVYVVGPMLDAYFVHASRDNVAAPPVVAAISGALAHYGSATVQALAPFVRGDRNDVRVARVLAMGKGAGWGLARAVDVLVDVGLPDVAGDVKTTADRLGTSAEDQETIKELARLLAGAPGTPAVRLAFESVFAKSDLATRPFVVMQIVDQREPAWIDGLAAVAADPKEPEAARTTALAGAIELGDKASLAAIAARLDAVAAKAIDPKTGASIRDLLAIDRALVDRCGVDGACWTTAFFEGAKDAAKESPADARARCEKALFMIAAYGKEADLAALVDHASDVPALLRDDLVRTLQDAQATRNGLKTLADAIDAASRLPGLDAFADPFARLATRIRLRTGAP